MKLNNKGFWHCCFIPKIVTAIVKGGTSGGHAFPFMFLIVGVLLIPLEWHIPAWTKAKKDGTEAQYQAQKMWPQGVLSTYKI